MSNIYKEAIADAKHLRAIARQDAQRQILEKFAPKVDQYIEQIILGEDDDSNDDENILTDVLDDSEMDDDAPPISSVNPDDVDMMASSDESAGITMNDDGTWTLDLDTVIIPTEQESDDLDADDSDINESFAHKLKKLSLLVETLQDKSAGYTKLVDVYNNATKRNVINKKLTNRARLDNLAVVARAVNESYIAVREDNKLSKNKKIILLEKLETAYTNTTDSISTVICEGIDKKMSSYVLSMLKLKKINQKQRNHKIKTLTNEIKGLNSVLEAIEGHSKRKQVMKLKSRMSNLITEMNKMRRNNKLNEDEDILLKLSFEDEDEADELRAALGQSEDMESDDESEDMESDDESEDELPETYSRRGRRMMESDDDSDADDDVDDDADDDDDDNSSAAAILKKVISAYESGDVGIEIVDDEEMYADMDSDMPEDDDDMIELGDDFGPEMSDMGDESEESDEIIEIDMSEVREAVRRQRQARARSQANFINESRRSSRRSSHRVSRPESHSGLRRQLQETKQKQADSNLLAAKLLYANRILMIEGLTTMQKKRITSALDDVRTLREARLMYNSLTKALRQKQDKLNEATHRPVGSASRVQKSGAPSQRAAVTPSVQENNAAMLHEHIDLDLWKKHAGIE